jgi:alpha-tubulin suppressor-like RCC1 family protein
MTGIPGLVAGAPPARSVTLGTGSACMLSTDHRVLCWGANGQGQLGNGSTTALTAPTEIQSGERFRAVAMGSNSACAITLGGRLYCWGSNSVGQLGDGSETRRLLPVPIAPTLRFARIRLAALSVCAQELRGPWYCWGLDDFSRVSGEAVSLGRVREPRLLPHVSPTHDMVLGPDVSCGLAPDGAATCWGDNRNTVLGDLGTTQKSTPTAIQPTWRFGQLALGDQAACGITTSAEVVCWGQNLHGGVGVADETFAAVPVRVEGVPAFGSITAGGGISCGLRSSGEAWCWGLGSLPQPVPGGHLFHEFEAGEAGACGLESDGEAWCWGNPALLGLEGDHEPTPRLVPGGHFFGAIAVGGTWACGKVSGIPWCWGSGRGTPSANQSIPFRVGSSDLVAGRMRATGPYGGMCGATPAGRVQCWFPGGGSQGITARLLETYFGPDPVDNLPNCTLLADGSTRCQNGNNFGPGTFTTALDGPCGIREDRIARCWGHNQNGALGIGARDAFFGTPQQILGPVAFVEVSIGATHGCGVTQFGEAWCWGTDRNLALGNGALFVFPTPQRIFASQGGLR